MADQIVREDSGGNGFMMGILILVVFLFLFFYFGLPKLRESAPTQITVPDEIDVNINQGDSE